MKAIMLKQIHKLTASSVQLLTESMLLITFCLQNQFKQRVWVRGARPEEEEIFQFTMIQVPISISLCFLHSIYW
jgi:hypothetical protein